MMDLRTVQTMNSGQNLGQNLKRALAAPLPGLLAQLAMAPRHGPDRTFTPAVEASCLKAGVMLLLYLRQDELHIVLTRRTSTVLRHKDQIGFPGGKFEGSEDAVRAALRETSEEIGIAQARIDVVGSMTPLFIPPSNFCIYPVVGTAEGPLVFTPERNEVAEIIEVPLARLMDPATSRREDWTLYGRAVEVPFYAFGPHKIWGATAMVLAEFLALLRTPV
jgi:8-oxo-dGTP pyrophosphatase MutT (NUDIX family)